jgi:hypothetical protein
MGKHFIDQYSLLHFAVGGIWKYYGLDFKSLLILHTIFEYIENTKYGMKYISKKKEPDSVANSMGDVISALFGFLIMDRCYQYKFLDRKFEDLCLGIVTFFWYFKKYGLTQSLIGLAVIYYILGNNLFLGFIMAYTVDYYGEKNNWVGNTQ